MDEAGSVAETRQALVGDRLAVRMVLLDLDGTLVHTAPDIAASANAMLERIGMASQPEPLVQTWIGNGVARLVKRALVGSFDGEPDAALYQRAYPIFMEEYAARVADRSRPYAGVVPGLEALQAMGFSLACITNKVEAFTEPLLRALQLDHFFELVLSGDSLPVKKPDPGPLLHACRYFNIEPDQGVLVGDSVNDTQAAAAAGMPVICVSYGYHQGKDLRAEKPAAVIDSLLELPDLLARA
jgi:phosphoglycolate phosphatase